MCELKRMWINQPSTLQPLNEWHGENVLACVKSYTENTVKVYCLAGDTVSMIVPRNSLSEGWVPKDDI